MRVIGFRCFTKAFIFVALEGNQTKWTVLEYGNRPFPKGISWCETLSWLRQEVHEILGKHKIQSASIRGMEGLAKRKPSYDARFEVEGVVKEAVFSKINRECIARVKSQIRRDIQNCTQPSRYLNEFLTDTEHTKLKAGDFPDATLVAIAELPVE